MMRFSGSTNHFFRYSFSFFVIGYYFYFSRFIYSIHPHQTIAVLQRTIILALFTITFTVDKQFGCRIVGIYKYRSHFAFTSRPCPVRQNMQGFRILVPYTAIQIIAVFRQTGKVDNTKHGTVIGPCIRVIR